MPELTNGISPREFDPTALLRGAKHAVTLDLAPDAPGIAIPVHVVNGARPGRMLVVTAGVHGDEYEGVRTVLDTTATLVPAELSGTVIAVPVANPPAFWNGTRTSPLDGGNLARAFPGDPQGKITEIIAHHLAHSIIARADFFLDLHSAGVQFLMPTMVGYDSNHSASRAAALAFGAPVVWAHSTMAPGRTVSFAASRGIPWLYTEARGAGRIHPDDLRVFRRGVSNLLRHLGMLPGTPECSPPAIQLCGDGDLDASLSASRAGFFIPAVELLAAVRAGQELGRSIDLYGQTVETFCSPRDGVVAMMRAFPVLHPGDAVFFITGTSPINA
ncbi:MAG: succinylglutamate desuccinylase/aspartoacylase family protein [Terriglobales bacterium]